MADSSRLIHLKIVTPKGIFLEDDVSELVAPGKDGDFGVQIGHTPFISSVRPGILKIYKNDKPELFSLMNGFVMVDIDKVRIFTEIIENPDDIDVNRAKRAKERAEKRLQEKKENTDLRRAEAALKRAVTRIQINEDGFH
ncbi:MAG TPA: F0F1 ATP synthase subunit epsilon [Candidatus Cloacimonetes bacterium]|nr:F0F1 ATP synthase subunit epsilon [Candidatus Cloacimonadota bacterium]HHE40921.1 F0F1 ATP synthase subunit epsilon [Candidatus Cloacimonadota bacterium]